jgi:hypothetical protein
VAAVALTAVALAAVALAAVALATPMASMVTTKMIPALIEASGGKTFL